LNKQSACVGHREKIYTLLRSNQFPLTSNCVECAGLCGRTMNSENYSSESTSQHILWNDQTKNPKGHSKCRHPTSRTQYVRKWTKGIANMIQHNNTRAASHQSQHNSSWEPSHRFARRAVKQHNVAPAQASKQHRQSGRLGINTPAETKPAYKFRPRRRHTQYFFPGQQLSATSTREPRATQLLRGNFFNPPCLGILHQTRKHIGLESDRASLDSSSFSTRPHLPARNPIQRHTHRSRGNRGDKRTCVQGFLNPTNNKASCLVKYG